MSDGNLDSPFGASPPPDSGTRGSRTPSPDSAHTFPSVQFPGNPLSAQSWGDPAAGQTSMGVPAWAVQATATGFGSEATEPIRAAGSTSPYGEHPLVPPTQVGAYRLGQVLGRGGMGIVVEAVDSHLNRRAAVKLLSPQLATNRESFERLRREAQASARLNHPNIVQVYAFGVEAGFPYIAMEHLRGRDLDALVRERGKIEPREALRMIREAAEALAFASREKIVHRDVKPSNLFLTESGLLKVMDFGLAKQIDADSSLTATGAVVGTPSYMSPEQVRGARELDFRSDMYSLGCTLFTLLAGERPHGTATPMEAMYRHATLGLAIPPEWDRLAGGRLVKLLKRMTAKEPADRFPSWEAAIHEMRQVEEIFVTGGGGIGAKAVWLGAGAAAVAASLVGGAFFVLHSTRQPALPAGVPAQPPGAIANVATPAPAPPAWTPAPVEAAPERTFAESAPAAPDPFAASDAAASRPPSGAPPEAGFDPAQGGSAPDPFGGAMQGSSPAPRPEQPGVQASRPGGGVGFAAARNAAAAGDWRGVREALAGEYAPETSILLAAVERAEALDALHGVKDPPGEPARQKRLALGRRMLAEAREKRSMEGAYDGLVWLSLLEDPNLEEFQKVLPTEFQPSSKHAEYMRSLSTVNIFLLGRDPLPHPGGRSGGGPSGGGYGPGGGAGGAQGGGRPGYPGGGSSRPAPR